MLRYWLALTSSILSLGLFVASVWPRSPLEERPGFAAAVAHVSASATESLLVVVTPPTSTSALSHIPHSLRATDAVPQTPASYTTIAILGPRGFPLPPELSHAPWRDVQTERTTFDDVDVLFVRRTP